jgi:hypothetical protein
MTAMSDDDADAAPRRPRGRRAAPPAGPTSGLRATLAPALAVVEPRIAAAGAWLYERRLHVFIVAATVATLVLIGGTVVLLQLSAPPPHGEDAAPAVSTSRPTSTEPAYPGTLAPILPSPAPPSPLPPLPGTGPGADSDPDPGDGPPPPDAGEPEAEPEPEPTPKPGRDTAPGQIKKKPGGSDSDGGGDG